MQISRRYRPALISFFLRRVRNHAEADDLTQEVFVRLASTDAAAGLERPDAYIFQTAANLLRDRSRREQVRRNFRQGVDPDAASIDRMDPSRVLIGRETLGEVTGALGQLPERTRAIFILYRLENLKHREIAEMFGISVSAVEKHVLRAMTHLTRCLGAAE